MKQHGYTIRKLAEATGVHFTTISRLLSEKTVANEETYQKLKNILR